MDTDHLVLAYLESGGCITVGQDCKPRKEELTFRNDKGSTYNIGRKAAKLQSKFRQDAGMLGMHTSYSFLDIENRRSRHYIHYMMMTFHTLHRKLYRFFIGPMRPTHTSYAFHKA